MKRVVSVAVLAIFVLNCAPTLPQHKYGTVERENQIIISERVGDVIDPKEREFFDLFLPEIYLKPVTYRYESATFHAIRGGGYELRISTVSDTLTIVNKDPQGIEILGDYIDNYETVVESTHAFEDKWGIVDYDFIGLPITQSEIQTARKRMIASAKRPSMRLQPIMVGAGIGGCLGGIVAYAITSDYEPEYSPWDPDPGEGCIGCLEISSIALVYIVGIAGGATAGSVTGCLVGRSMQEDDEMDFEDSVVLEAIKGGRKPRLVE